MEPRLKLPDEEVVEDLNRGRQVWLSVRDEASTGTRKSTHMSLSSSTQLVRALAMTASLLFFREVPSMGTTPGGVTLQPGTKVRGMDPVGAAAMFTALRGGSSNKPESVKKKCEQAMNKNTPH